VIRKPALLLGNTGQRVAILIHPGQGFLSSIGCFNPCPSLPNAAEPIDHAPSRRRVIAIINDPRTYLGAGFPSQNGRRIPRASVVVDGEHAL
jgi:hypothetical protein